MTSEIKNIAATVSIPILNFIFFLSLIFFMWKYISLSNDITKMSNNGTQTISNYELIPLKNKIDQYNIVRMVLLFISSALIATSTNRYPSLLLKIKNFAKENIIFFEYLFFGAASINLIKTNTLNSNTANGLLLLLSFVLTILAVSTIRFNARSNFSKSIIIFLISIVIQILLNASV